MKSPFFSCSHARNLGIFRLPLRLTQFGILCLALSLSELLFLMPSTPLDRLGLTWTTILTFATVYSASRLCPTQISYVLPTSFLYIYHIQHSLHYYLDVDVLPSNPTTTYYLTYLLLTYYLRTAYLFLTYLLLLTYFLLTYYVLST